MGSFFRMTTEKAMQKLEYLELDPQIFSGLQEVGESATWTLSSAKSGNGIGQLLDPSPDTFWQSDGSQAHSITAQFPKKISIRYICLLLRTSLDESYTPQKITIKIGSIWNDLVDLKFVEFDHPEGWQVIELEPDGDQSVRGSMLQIVITANYRNGRDTHIRGVKIYGPVEHVPDLIYPEFSVQDNIPIHELGMFINKIR